MASGSTRKRSRIPEQIYSHAYTSDYLVNQDTNIVTNSIDPSSDHTFLVEHIEAENIFLTGLLSNCLTNRSFTNLYERSNLLGWRQLFRELLSSLKSDDNKSKFKQLALYRLIDEYFRNPSAFDENVRKLNQLMKIQLYSSLTPIHPWFNRLAGINDVYAEVNKWRELQWNRRLLHKECWEQCNLLILQDQLTTYFLELAESSYIDDGALQQLFDHCLVIVGQPSGSGCLAVAKYEKIGQEYLAKIRARVICLLDFARIQNHLTCSNIDVKLCLNNSQIDPTGDIQKPLLWKKRIIKCTENRERTLLYFEYSGNDVLHLTKKTLSDKPLYNNQLCRLEFQMFFALRQRNIQTWIMTRSEIFAVCSHGKFYSECLRKVFLEEIKNNFLDINGDTHINALVEYINSLHKRITGVEAKSHTQTFMHDELKRIHDAYSISAYPSTPLEIDIYEDVLEEWITQMRFMACHLFLTMMYTDNLFLGICGSEVDQDMCNSNGTIARLAMRFARVSEQETPDNPNILFIGYSNNKSWTSRISHNKVAKDMFTCIYAAAEAEQNQIEVYHREGPSPFTDFRRYYDSDLHCNHSVQPRNSLQSIPLSVLLQNLTETREILLPTMINHSSTSSTINLCLQHTGDENLSTDLVNFIQQHYAQWCQSKNVQGSIIYQQTDTFNTSDTEFLFDECSF